MVMTNPHQRQRSYTTRKASVNLTYTFNLTTVMMTCNGARIQSSCLVSYIGLGVRLFLKHSPFDYPICQGTIVGGRNGAPTRGVQQGNVLL